VSVRYLALDDCLAIAVEVTGQQVATIVGAADLDLADSALHAPVAGFSGRRVVSRLRRQGGGAHRPAGQEPPAPRRKQASRLGVAAGVRRAQRLDDRALPVCRRGRSRRPRHRRGRLGPTSNCQLAQAHPSPTAPLGARLPRRPVRPSVQASPCIPRNERPLRSPSTDRTPSDQNFSGGAPTSVRKPRAPSYPASKSPGHRPDPSTRTSRLTATHPGPTASITPC
jgi:hypothetical protein